VHPRGESLAKSHTKRDASFAFQARPSARESGSSNRDASDLPLEMAPDSQFVLRRRSEPPTTMHALIACLNTKNIDTSVFCISSAMAHIGAFKLGV
jgi:hypothetical protein